MGSLAIIGTNTVQNLKHIIINNGSHDSVGGQPTAGFNIDFLSIAKACGYVNASGSETLREIKEQILNLKNSKGPSFA
jgi:phosphonopyruvate decarboxylase